MPNSTAMSWAQPELEPELERSPCLVGIIPIVYYSVLLGLGLPGEGLRGQGGLEGKSLGWRDPTCSPPTSDLAPVPCCAAQSQGRCHRHGDRWYLHCLG